MDSKSLFDEGKLSEAFAAQLDYVKRNPTDLAERIFLAELACFLGDWERADKQLHAAETQAVDPLPLVSLLRNLVRGEIRREQFFDEVRAPDLLQPLNGHAEAQMKLAIQLRDPSGENIAARIQESQDLHQTVKWLCDGQEVSGLLDLDDRFHGVAELITATGKYFWIPWNDIRKLEFEKPTRPRDLIWRKADIATDQGIQGKVYFPVRYPNPKGWKQDQQLGRQTDWEVLVSNLTSGVGQRLLLLGEQDRGILEINKLERLP
jgi:type VI secretion system protein ImpE